MWTSIRRSAIVFCCLAGTSLQCSAKDCSPPVRVELEQVSSKALECIRATLPQHGMKLPLGSSGTVTGPPGTQASFSWDERNRTLIIMITSRPLFVSCEEAAADVKDFGTACTGTDTVVQLTHSASSETWRIESPDIRKSDTVYPQIPLRPEDVLSVTAGGCAQTGGHGSTWRLYVDHPGDSLHHGTIKIPGQDTFTRLKDIRPGDAFTVPIDWKGDMQLHLGYEDTDYSRNGYWGRDPGPNGECRKQPNAWVQITIKRRPLKQ